MCAYVQEDEIFEGVEDSDGVKTPEFSSCEKQKEDFEQRGNLKSSTVESKDKEEEKYPEISEDSANVCDSSIDEREDIKNFHETVTQLNMSNSPSNQPADFADIIKAENYFKDYSNPTPITQYQMDTDMTFINNKEASSPSSSTGSIVRFNVRSTFKRTLSKDSDKFQSDAPETPQSSSKQSLKLDNPKFRQPVNSVISLPSLSKEILLVTKAKEIKLEHDSEITKERVNLNISDIQPNPLDFRKKPEGTLPAKKTFKKKRKGRNTKKKAESKHRQRLLMTIKKSAQARFYKPKQLSTNYSGMDKVNGKNAGKSRNNLYYNPPRTLNQSVATFKTHNKLLFKKSKKGNLTKRQPSQRYYKRPLNLLQILQSQKELSTIDNDDIECSFRPVTNQKSLRCLSARNLVANSSTRDYIKRNLSVQNFGSMLHCKHTVSSLRRSASNSKSRSKGETSPIHETSYSRNLMSTPSSFVHSPETSQNSSRYYSSLQKKIFKQIFDQINSEKLIVNQKQSSRMKNITEKCLHDYTQKNHQICNQNLTLDDLDLQTVKILTPVIKKIQASETGISRCKFVKSCLELYKTLTQKEKTHLLKLHSHSCSESVNGTFMPTLSKKSRAIVKKLPQEDSVQERLYKLHQERRSRLFQEKKKKDLEEIEKCSFYPATSRSTGKFKRILES
ncbi:unnamed protein product [Moneuplotes crassus]|uniref:Uncharacterized protein n=1 Tax=Euplotes crassus TaxID=5936 RepID=A0AAD1Y717_EUPCR|nr:unnamed protein product [Moneuplotes crassus]